MSTPHFNSLILTSAQRLKDIRTDPSSAGDAGRRYKSDVLAGYCNRAVRDLLLVQFKAMGNNFGSLIPEYMQTTGVLTVAGASTPRPVDSWIVTDLMTSDKTTRFDRLDDDEIFDVIVGKRTVQVPTDKRPSFYQEGANIVLLPTNTAITGVIARYIRTHVDITVNGANDLILSTNWDGEIIDRMVTMGTLDADKFTLSTPQQVGVA